ncbi:MAG: hypothetical protein IJA36_10455 [Lachnospiraceae bacterium]|nr:hypothetical protein [Lachnospiraceae bacterium]
MFDREYAFYGKHAKMIEKLKANLSDEIGRGFFETTYDIYQVAPFIGWIYRRRSKIDKTEETTKIFQGKMMTEKNDLVFNYRNMMALHFGDRSTEELMNIAFKLDYNDEARKEYDEIYNSYVLGGLEEMYEQIFLKDGASTTDEYIQNLYEFLEELNMRLYGVMDEDE